jgi:hypothetical protein
MNKTERQRIMRGIEGSPAREAMLRWRRSQGAKEAWKRYYDSEHGRERIRASKRKGTSHYEKRQKRRADFRIAATKGRHRWSDRDEQRLRELVASGEREADIATLLGRSLSSIMHKKRKLGLTHSVTA